MDLFKWALLGAGVYWFLNKDKPEDKKGDKPAAGDAPGVVVPFGKGKGLASVMAKLDTVGLPPEASEMQKGAKVDSVYKNLESNTTYWNFTPAGSPSSKMHYFKSPTGEGFSGGWKGK
jgi:hypothetical protein